MTDRMTMNDRCDEIFNRRAAPRVLSDSDRNILADLAGEADEPCAVCDTMVRPRGARSARSARSGRRSWTTSASSARGGVPVLDELLIPPTFQLSYIVVHCRWRGKAPPGRTP